jgi:hypothetical protein
MYETRKHSLHRQKTNIPCPSVLGVQRCSSSEVEERFAAIAGMAMSGVITVR